MNDRTHTTRPEPSAHPGAKAGVKRRYQTPRLERLGDIRSRTLGPSPGVGESSGGNIRKGGVG